jgi:hypothetical protein
VIYLYAIVDGLGTIADLKGVDREPLTIVEFDDVHVVAGEVPSAPEVTRDVLAAQDAIVRSLHDRAAALLPMRFGSAFASRDAAAQAVAVHAIGLHERLTRVRGKEQMTIRITGLTESAAPRSGADYLRDRARPPELAPLFEALAPLASATHVERRHNSGLVTVYQLIERGLHQAYRQTVSDTTATIPASSVRVSGPAPCYAFT